MSFQPHKTDAELGLKVQRHLESLGLHTPTTFTGKRTQEEIDSAYDVAFGIIEVNTHQNMVAMGLDMNDDSLIDTPKRVAKMYLNELYWGLLPQNFPKCTAIENKMQYDEMVIEKDVSVLSTCEHHLVTIDGLATVAYIPGDYVLGLSKMNRIVEYFSRRPQVQERLGAQILEAMKFVLKTDDVAVSINAKHYCVASRGVEDSNSYTVTNHLSGVFKDKPEVRQEFLSF